MLLSKSLLCSACSRTSVTASSLLSVAKAASSYVPIVITSDKGMERAMDIYSRLLDDRIVCLQGQINEAEASAIVAQLLFLESSGPKKPISLYINSPGGHIASGLAIYDTMRYISSPIATVCVGQACSMAAVILSGGDRGMRKCLPNARVMIHQPRGGVQGPVTDIDIVAKEMQVLKSSLLEILASNTGKSIEEIEKISDRDFFMSADESKSFGIVDSVLKYKK